MYSPRFMYHKELEGKGCYSSEQEADLRAQGYGWRVEIFPELCIGEVPETYREHMEKWESEEEKPKKKRQKAAK